MKKRLKFLSLMLMPFLLGADPVTLTDPTRPPGSVLLPNNLNAGRPLSVSAIFIYPASRFAIINNQVLKQGDKVSEFTITTITPYTVELIGPQNNKEILEVAPNVKKEVTRNGF